MKSVRTAIIPVAGYGTRRLPITKAIEKCMLPIHDRPAVDFVVEDCAAAGIEHIIFVVGEDSRQLHTYYGHNRKLEQYLKERGKTEELAAVNATGRGLKFSYVTQPQDGAYGTAVPVHLALSLLTAEDEYFAVMMGDDFVYREDGGSELADAMRDFQESSADHMMLSAEIPHDQASSYGVLKTNGGMLSEILEKPALTEVEPPCFINISKFVFSSRICDHLENYMNRRLKDGEEYRLTDVVLEAVHAGEQVTVRPVVGRYLDVGNADAWLTANNVVAQADTKS